MENRIKLRIKAPAVDGKANEVIIKVLAKEFRTAKSTIQILSGRNSKKKLVIIQKPGRLPDLTWAEANCSVHNKLVLKKCCISRRIL